MGKRHIWTLNENQYCVDVVIEHFVLDNWHELKRLTDDLYIHFEKEISYNSIKMKLQNIKYLLEEYKVKNSLLLRPLSNYSQDNLIAFLKAIQNLSQDYFQA